MLLLIQSIEGIQLYLLSQNPTENPKPLRHQIKVRIWLFLYEDQTVDSSPLIATITIAIWT